MAECNAFVAGGGVLAHKCREEEGHQGPCATPDIPKSVTQRNRWKDGEQARMTLAQFQGPAQTTAERYTENPTPVPGREATLEEHPGTTATRPSLRKGTDVLRMMQACKPCKQGDHEHCDAIVLNEGAVDAQDFISVSCTCIESYPQIHGFTDGLDEAGDLEDPEPQIADGEIISIEGEYVIGSAPAPLDVRMDADFVYGFLAAAFGLTAEVTQRAKHVLDHLGG